MPVLQNNPKFESSRASDRVYTYDLRNRDFRKKPPIGHFCKYTPKLRQDKKSQNLEVHREYNLNSTPKPRQPMYRGLYIDELLSYTQHHPVSSNLSPETFFITTDRQFSVRAVVDSDGVIQEERNYDPFGKDYNGDAEESGLAYGFTGRRYDHESDLYYFRARYYSTELGSFISRDPHGTKALIWNSEKRTFVRNIDNMYIDGMNLYLGYFGSKFNLDPSGEREFVLYLVYDEDPLLDELIPKQTRAVLNSWIANIFNSKLEEDYVTVDSSVPPSVKFKSGLQSGKCAHFIRIKNKKYSSGSFSGDEYIGDTGPGGGLYAVPYAEVDHKYLDITMYNNVFTWAFFKEDGSVDGPMVKPRKAGDVDPLKFIGNVLLHEIFLHALAEEKDSKTKYKLGEIEHYSMTLNKPLWKKLGKPKEETLKKYLKRADLE